MVCARSGRGGPMARPSICYTKAASTTDRSPPPCSPAETRRSSISGVESKASSSPTATRSACNPFATPSHIASPNENSVPARACSSIASSDNSVAIPTHIRGPEAQSHFELALAVASGIADAALGARSAAAALHLGFVPVTWEPYELVVPGDRLGLTRPLIEALEDPSTEQRIAALTGYDLADAGQVFDVE